MAMIDDLVAGVAAAATVSAAVTVLVGNIVAEVETLDTEDAVAAVTTVLTSDVAVLAAAVAGTAATSTGTAAAGALLDLVLPETLPPREATRHAVHALLAALNSSDVNEAWAALRARYGLEA
jgi:hypothetical protein